MASELARERAAQAWCGEKTKDREMDVELAEAFADILDDVWSNTNPWRYPSRGELPRAERIYEVTTTISGKAEVVSCQWVKMRFREAASGYRYPAHTIRAWRELSEPAPKLEGSDEQ